MTASASQALVQPRVRVQRGTMNSAFVLYDRETAES